MQKNFFIVLIVLAFVVGYGVNFLFDSNTKHEKFSGNFNDLPQKVQKQYIKRDSIEKIKPLLAIESKKIIPSNNPIEGNSEELKEQIRELRQTNQILYKENVELSNKSWNLAIELQGVKDDVANEKEQLKAKSLENINESERQHYKNVNDLTKKINELQQEAIASTEKYEAQIIGLENNIEELKHSLQNKEFDINEKINVATQKERISKTNLAEKNRNLLSQIELMKEKIKNTYEENSKALKEKKDEIVSLKKELSAVDAKTNMILTKHTNEILEINQRNTSVLKKLRQSMENIQQDYKKQIAEKNDKIALLMKDNQKEISSLKSSYEKDDSKLQNALISAKKSEKISLETIAKLNNEKKELTETIGKLKEKLGSIDKRTKEIISKKDKEYALMLKEIKRKTLLRDANISIDKNKEDFISKKQFNKNEQRHAQNYQTLNTQIIELKKQREEFVVDAKKMMDKLEEQMKTKEQKSKNAITFLENEIKKYKQNTQVLENSKTKDKKIESLTQEVGQKNQLLTTLKDDISTLKKELKAKDSTAKENKELKKAQKSLDHALARMSSLEDDIATLVQEKKSIQKENEMLKAQNSQNIDKKLEKALKKVKDKQMDIEDLESTIAFLEEKNLKLKEGGEQNTTAKFNKLNQKLQEKENELLSLRGDIVVLEKKNNELTTKNKALLSDKKGASNTNNSQKEFDSLRNDLINRKAEILALKSEFDSLVKTNMELKKQLKEIPSSNPLNIKNGERIASLEEELKTLENENIELSQALEKVQVAPSSKAQTVAKNSLQGSITCDDMPRGSNNPTKHCKERVKKFLDKYNLGHFFEIVPIVDNGGFASLKKVQNSNLGISKNEIERLTRLSNLGIGKDRAASGGTLVKEILGDDAIISYAVTNKDIKKKRGFVINAYK